MPRPGHKVFSKCVGSEHDGNNGGPLGGTDCFGPGWLGRRKGSASTAVLCSLAAIVAPAIGVRPHSSTTAKRQLSPETSPANVFEAWGYSPDDRRLGPASPNSRPDVIFGLVLPPSDLAQFAQSVSQPGNPRYRHYEDVASLAAQTGATNSTSSRATAPSRCCARVARSRQCRSRRAQPRAVDLAIGERLSGPIFVGVNKLVGPHTLRHTSITAALDAGVPLRDVQEAASHADPRTTMRYDRARVSLDRHATYIVATYIAGASR